MIGTFLETLQAFLTNYSPVILSIIGMIGTYIVAIQQFKGSKTDIDNTRKAIQEDQQTFKKSLKDEMRETNELCHQVLIENMELKRQNRELKVLITKVDDRKDPTDEE